MSNNFDHDVVIAGGGPTGMMLAAELALAGVDVVVIERRVDPEFAGSRAGGLHARTLEVLDQRGVAERFIEEGTKHAAVGFHVPLDLSDQPSRHNYLLGLWQRHTERILAGWLAELPVTTRHGLEVTGFTQDADGVDVALGDGSTLRARFLVGCDGGRSTVRRAAGIDFAGWDASISWLMAEVAYTEEPKWGFHFDARGRHAIAKAEDGRAGVVLIESAPREGERTMDDVRDALVAVYGTDFGAHSPSRITSFTDAARQAAAYRDRRVLLAGDAAHVHAPLGGQGLNLGVQDAVNLGWKLAQVVKGISPDSLLDSYHAERHPVAARVLRSTMAQVALGHTDDRTKALGEIVGELLRLDEPRRHMAAEMSGLGVHYDLGAGHPLLGRRMPDLDIVTGGRTRRVFELMHDARPLLIDLGTLGDFDATPWTDRVRRVDARYDGAWVLPAIGSVQAPGAVLVRPDGYVAWVGAGNDQGPAEALATWFGPVVRNDGADRA